MPQSRCPQAILSARLDSNQEPRRYKLRALTIELRAGASGMPDVSDDNLPPPDCIEDEIRERSNWKYSNTRVVRRKHDKRELENSFDHLLDARADQPRCSAVVF